MSPPVGVESLVPLEQQLTRGRTAVAVVRLPRVHDVELRALDVHLQHVHVRVRQSLHHAPQRPGWEFFGAPVGSFVDADDPPRLPALPAEVVVDAVRGRGREGVAPALGQRHLDLPRVPTTEEQLVPAPPRRHAARSPQRLDELRSHRGVVEGVRLQVGMRPQQRRVERKVASDADAVIHGRGRDVDRRGIILPGVVLPTVLDELVGAGRGASRRRDGRWAARGRRCRRVVHVQHHLRVLVVRRGIVDPRSRHLPRFLVQRVTRDVRLKRLDTHRGDLVAVYLDALAPEPLLPRLRRGGAWDGDAQDHGDPREKGDHLSSPTLPPSSASSAARPSVTTARRDFGTLLDSLTREEGSRTPAGSTDRCFL